MTKPALTMLLTLLPLVASLPVTAQWQILAPDRNSGNDRGMVAQVENASGYRLQIQRDIDDTVHGFFELSRGFDLFPDDGCPTARIDTGQPLNLFDHTRSCIANGHRVEFTFGTIEDSSIQSEVLLQLMNGKELLLRYPLQYVGYRETRFSLNRSKQVLGELLGQGVSPRGR